MINLGFFIIDFRRVNFMNIWDQLFLIKINVIFKDIYGLYLILLSIKMCLLRGKFRVILISFLINNLEYDIGVLIYV